MNEPQKKQKSLKEIQAHIRKVANTEWEKAKGDNPGLSGWVMKQDMYCYRKRPSGFEKVIERIMDAIAYPAGTNYETGVSYPAGADRTQKQIIETIRPSFPSHNIQPNVWNRKLTAKQFERMRGMAARNFRKPIDIKGCKTLAEVKKRIQAALHAKDATYQFKGTIAIDDMAVVIGKDVYPIEKRVSAGHEYPSIRVDVDGKRQWLRVDVLRSVLPYKMMITEKRAGERVTQSA